MSRQRSVSRQDITKLRYKQDNLQAGQYGNFASQDKNIAIQDKKLDNFLRILSKLTPNSKDTTKTLTPPQVTSYHPLPSQQSS